MTNKIDPELAKLKAKTAALRAQNDASLDAAKKAVSDAESALDREQEQVRKTDK